MKKTLFSLLLMLSLFGTMEVVAQKKAAPTPKVEIKTLLNEFKVMSFGIRMPNAADGKYHWKFRKNSTIEAIKAQDPSILLLHDVNMAQISEIKDALSDYSLVEGVAVMKTTGSYAPIFYKKSLFNVLERKSGWVGSEGDVPTRAFRSFDPMVYNMLKLQDKQTRQAFFIYNYILDKNAVTLSHSDLARYFANILQSPNRNRLPIIFAGDFKINNQGALINTLSIKVIPELAVKSLNQSLVEAFTTEITSTELAKKAAVTEHDLSGALKAERTNLLVFSPGWSCAKQDVISEKYNDMYPAAQFPIIASFKFVKEVPIKALKKTVTSKTKTEHKNEIKNETKTQAPTVEKTSKTIVDDEDDW